METALLTGSAGLVGRALGRRLASEGYRVRLFDLDTGHVLLAAEQARVSRVVSFSSVQVFGFADGEGAPVYLPVDDDHPLHGARPYGMSKWLAEEMCAAWSERTGITTVVLRPAHVLAGTGDYDTTAARTILGWRPTRGWPVRTGQTTG